MVFVSALRRGGKTLMEDLKDWRFWIGASVIGYLILANYQAFNTIIVTGSSFAQHYTQILQGRGPGQFVQT